MLPTPDTIPALPENSLLALPLARADEQSASKSYAGKRLFDVVFSLVVICLLLVWLVPLIALLIKLESRGPVFFRQLRTGKNGKPFYCLKFRSMCPNTQADSQQAHRHDARITLVGSYLRKTSLDELPQFFNVLRGEMSIVGPRPHMLAHTEVYTQVVAHYMDRHAVLPGITGLAQVSGHRGETRTVDAMAKRVAADLHYIQHWSFGLDMKIIWLTVQQTTVMQEHVF